MEPVAWMASHILEKLAFIRLFLTEFGLLPVLLSLSLGMGLGTMGKEASVQDEEVEEGLAGFGCSLGAAVSPGTHTEV